MNFLVSGCFISAYAELKNQKAEESKTHTETVSCMQDSTATALSSVALLFQMLVTKHLQTKGVKFFNYCFVHISINCF